MNGRSRMYLAEKGACCVRRRVSYVTTVHFVLTRRDGKNTVSRLGRDNDFQPERFYRRDREGNGSLSSRDRIVFFRCHGETGQQFSTEEILSVGRECY